MNIILYVKMRDSKTDGVIITFVEITMRIKDLKEQEKLIADHEILLDTISALTVVNYIGVKRNSNKSKPLSASAKLSKRRPQVMLFEQ